MKGQTLQEWAGVSRMFALVFTDVVDSTTLANQMGDEKWIEVLRRHFAQARRLMSAYDHHEIKIIGDSFMVIFRTALDALDFVLALQRETGDARIVIRAGIHVGSARIIEDDIFGNMVNYTKRIEGVQVEGGITLSDAARGRSPTRKRTGMLGSYLSLPQLISRDFQKMKWSGLRILLLLSQSISATRCGLDCPA